MSWVPISLCLKGVGVKLVSDGLYKLIAFHFIEVNSFYGTPSWWGTLRTIYASRRVTCPIIQSPGRSIPPIYTSNMPS